LETGFGTTNNMNQEEVVDAAQVNNVLHHLECYQQNLLFYKNIMNQDELIRFVNAFNIL
jgi:hypothetical protein